MRPYFPGANGVLRSHCISCFVSRRQQSAKKNGTSADEGKQTPPYCHTGENYCGSASVPRTEAVNARMMQTSAAYPRVHVTLHDPQKSKSEEADELSRCGGGEGVNGINDKAETVFGGNRVGDLSENEVRAFLFRKEREIAHHHQQRNSTIPYPPHPDDVVPQFRRIKRHQQMLVVALDPDYPVYDRRDNVPELPPAQSHPWVKKTPTGPFIVHGDGQLGVVGTGEVGFEDAFTSDNTTEVAAATMGEVMLPLPRDFRGLQHRSTLHQSLPSCNGKVLQETVIKNSFALTGRGVFTTRDVSAGETIMIVRNTARNLGVKSEIERLVEMCTDVLSDTYNNFCNGNPQKLDFLHDWVLTGQPSSLLLHWPRSATKQVLECIGGAEVLRALELHEIHIARLAAIMDMNSFLVESSYAVRKGMAYFPEAGFFNHSCSPNATYDVIPAHTFCETDYYVDELGDSANAAFCATNYGEYTKSSNNDIVDATSGRNTTSDTKSDRDASEDECMEDVHNADGNQIIPSGTVEYLFCCRATADIPAGSEILISYVPPEWSFDNRQYVLHDRYRFWCKCPKCAPTLDSKYARTPRLLVAMLIFSIFLQLLVMRQRDMEHATMRERETGEEEEMRHGESGREKLKRRARGLFELLEESRQEEMYTPDRGPIPERVAQDPWARPAR
ncbi:hypothetical protein, conserved [Trypanosoma brucei brucei TREU927]|uniref:SET domain-containing protein n=1 Tax=Trypanosoma brucei brucei (strain 927/4 GUTat10.1) TaxID=185431 RepID=Q38BM6_TRYB2|nr:hypothetical protein, conserved [Trypanosoma brucei brucei TREU927]EAN77794.1 hypothetical protein, conserved [Trypanosoma brucei brucei TREU927]